MYGGDSFLALSLPYQIGLALISAVLFVSMIALVRIVANGWPLVVRVMLALVILWLFIWCAPQVYHSYYAFAFDDVPQSWIIGAPPPLGLTLRVVTFTGPADYLHNAAGVLGIVMIFAALRRQSDPS